MSEVLPENEAEGTAHLFDGAKEEEGGENEEEEEMTGVMKRAKEDPLTDTERDREEREVRGVTRYCLYAERVAKVNRFIVCGSVHGEGGRNEECATSCVRYIGIYSQKFDEISIQIDEDFMKFSQMESGLESNKILISIFKTRFCAWIYSYS